MHLRYEATFVFEKLWKKSFKWNTWEQLLCWLSANERDLKSVEDLFLVGVCVEVEDNILWVTVRHESHPEATSAVGRTDVQGQYDIADELSREFEKTVVDASWPVQQKHDICRRSACRWFK